MKISVKCEYGLRCLMDLSVQQVQSPGTSVHIEEIARRQQIPLKFLQTIILSLKKSSMVDSKKGPGGGYFLVKKPHEITLGDVLRSLEGDLGVLRRQNGRKTGNAWQQAADKAWLALGAALSDAANAKTLEDVLHEYRRLSKSEGSDMYYI